jgi:hypothetical protein
MNKSLLKYKIAFLVLLLLTVGIAGLVLIEASTTKHDTNTNDTANNIATQLNSYVETSQTIPGSLRQAGVKSVPKTISYQKLSSSSYKFCVTYKGTSSGFDAPGVAFPITPITMTYILAQPTTRGSIVRRLSRVLCHRQPRHRRREAPLARNRFVVMVPKLSTVV